MAAATIDDLVGWSIFGLVVASATGVPSGMGDIVQTILFVSAAGLAAVVVGYRGPRFVSAVAGRLAWPQGFLTLVLSLAVAAGALTEAFKVHAVLGTFLLGVALSEAARAGDWSRLITDFVMSFFAPLYFVSIGLQADFVAQFHLGLVFAIVALASLSKTLGAWLGARLGGMGQREALAVGFGMNARGAVLMVMASLALERGLIEERMFVALIVTALVTSLMSGPAMRKVLG